MRLGKFVEHIKAAAVATDAKGMDPVLRYCAIGRQLGYAAYMTLDNISAVSRESLCSRKFNWWCEVHNVYPSRYEDIQSALHLT